MQISRVPEKGKTAVAQAMLASFNGTPYLMERLEGFSICAAVVETVATVAGSFKLQASNNAFADDAINRTNAGAVWVDIPSSSVPVSGAGNFFWNVSDVNYEAVRIVWTSTGGDGNVSVYFLAKG